MCVNKPGDSIAPSCICHAPTKDASVIVHTLKVLNGVISDQIRSADNIRISADISPLIKIRVQVFTLFTTSSLVSARAVASPSHSIQTMSRWEIFIAVRLILYGLSLTHTVMADKGLSEKPPSNKDSGGSAVVHTLISACWFREMCQLLLYHLYC